MQYPDFVHSYLRRRLTSCGGTLLEHFNTTLYLKWNIIFPNSELDRKRNTIFLLAHGCPERIARHASHLFHFQWRTVLLNVLSKNSKLQVSHIVYPSGQQESAMSTTIKPPTKRADNQGSVPVNTEARKPTELQFLVSTNVDKPDADLRKFIRRHVMQGKNKGKTPRPSTKPRKPRQRKNNPSDVKDGSQSADSNQDSNRSSSEPLVVVPRKFGATWSAVRLASDVDPSSVEVILQREYQEYSI